MKVGDGWLAVVVGGMGGERLSCEGSSEGPKREVE